ncbi:MAG TPA: thioredoxin family protein [Gammaproteobacteria bacterium]|nr:thioredoxin family protein [Gammaproteobacteria bacterium]
MMRARYRAFTLCLVVLLTACGFGPRVDVGMQAPPIATKTLADVGGDFGKITTYRHPDARMYQYSLDQALKTGKPIVLAFATPGHCTPCDQQLQMLKAMMNKYEPRVLFMHIDQYQNPQAFKAFGIMGDPWTYVIDQKQTVRYVQSGRVMYGELEAQLSRVLPAVTAKQ